MDLPDHLQAYSQQASQIADWLQNGCDQDQFDEHASSRDFDSFGYQWYHGDTPMLNPFNPGQHWLELLKILQSENLVEAEKKDGKIHYSLPS